MWSFPSPRRASWARSSWRWRARWAKPWRSPWSIGNDPKIQASLFAPGYSIAAVIANEFTEATGELYTSALIELGLVLFALTIVINGVARLLMSWQPTRKGT